MATISDIARAANVSPALVSRIVNNDETLRVSDDTRERVQAIIDKLDYAPNAAARSLRSAQSGLLALVVHDLTNPVYSEIVSGAQIAAARRRKAVLLGEVADLGAGIQRIEDLIGGGGVDGIILQGAGTQMDRALARAARRRMPIVLLQSGEAKDATLIRFDDEGASRMATRHLIDLGHRNIGFLGVDGELAFSRGRQDGWTGAMADSGLSVRPSWSGDAGNGYEAGFAAAAVLMARAPELTAVVVSNVVAAVGVMASLRDMGRRIPDDLSLIALHDMSLAQYVRPALTVVKMPLRQLGEAAVEAVCAPGTDESRQRVIGDPPPHMVVRATTAPPRGAGNG